MHRGEGSEEQGSLRRGCSFGTAGVVFPSAKEFSEREKETNLGGSSNYSGENESKKKPAKVVLGAERGVSQKRGARESPFAGEVKFLIRLPL